MRSSRLARLVAAGLGALLLAIGLGTLVPLSPDRPPARPGDVAAEPDKVAAGPNGVAAEPNGRHRVLVVANPIHTDIALPVDEGTLARFAFLQAAGLPAERATWLLFGRGGRSFYIETPNWSDLRPVPLLKSFTLDSAVMHVGLSGPLAEGADVRALSLDDAAYAALLSGIEQSFAGPSAIPGAGYGPYDRFFEATGRFNALAGCNVWTAAMLRRAGLATGLWTPLPRTLFWSLDLHDGTRPTGAFPSRVRDEPGRP